MIEIELKKALRPVDLSLKAARKRQSAKTRFVHGTSSDPTAIDLISIYENFCFAMALLEQRKADDVAEAKELISKLLAFQTTDGNFPLFLHEYPICYDFHQRLKIAPFILRMTDDFGSVLGSEIKDALVLALKHLLHFDKELIPFWQWRKDLCLGKTKEIATFHLLNPLDLWEYWISLQLIQTPSTNLFHPGLKIFGGPPLKVGQMGLDTEPQLLEWMIAPEEKPEHPAMIYLSALKELKLEPFELLDWKGISKEDFLLLKAPSEDAPIAAKLLWKGSSRIHSLVIATNGMSSLLEAGVQTDHRLVNPCPISRTDLFELNLYFDADPELDITIGGVKGTVFQMGDELILKSPSRTIVMKCEIAQGTGVFAGHIFKANRPQQIEHKGFEAFDWRVAIRTINRLDECTLRWTIQIF